MGVWDNSAGDGFGQALVSVQVERADGTTADLVPDILHPGSDLTVQMAGRDSEFGTIQSGYADLALINSSGAYTPGVATAPVSLAQDMPLSIRETVGRRTFDLFAGVLGQPTATFDDGIEDGVADRVSVTALDWSGQQQPGRTFISNLGEWILWHGGTALQGYWPATEAAKPFLPAVNTATSPEVSYHIFGSSQQPVAGEVAITAASTQMPLGEDARIATVGGPLDSTGQPAYAYHMGVTYASTSPGSPFVAPRIGAGEVFTIVVWRSPVLFTGAIQELFNVLLVEQPSGSSTILSLSTDTSGHLSLDVSGLTFTGSVTASSIQAGTYPVAFRFGFSPLVLEAWVGRTRYVGSLSGSGPTAVSFGSADSGGFATQGGFGHLQVYAGAASAWTFVDYLAQIDHASNAMTGGGRWQRTDERLRMLARYAGLSDGQLDYDRGAAYMERASLAGSTWQAQADLAVATEQGRLFIAGDGRQVFHNRVTTKYDF